MREVGALFISVPSMSVCRIRHFRNERELGRVTSRKASGTVTKETEKKGALGSLSCDVLERRTSIGSGRFALLSRDFKKMWANRLSV